VTEVLAWVDAADLACITDASARAGYAAAASNLLWRASGGVGLVTDTARPCPPAFMRCSRWDALAAPYGPTLGCGAVSMRIIPGAVSVEAVSVDADTLDPSAYRLEADRLIRVDGSAWPVCQDLAAAPGEVGAFVVTYTRGVDPGEAGRLAARQLACQLAKFDAGEACGIPATARSVNRQGVSFNLAAWLEDGKATGLPLVDVFLAPFKGAGSPAVYNRDVHARRSTA
jgi:hypothetical protein